MRECEHDARDPGPLIGTIEALFWLMEVFCLVLIGLGLSTWFF